MSRFTRRWEGALAATVLLGAIGLLDRNPALLLAGVVPLAYAAYGSMADASIPDDVSFERSIEPTPAPPGRAVFVSLTVTNESARTLADCRIVDGVPDELAVVSGTPRAGVTLAPGESTELSYEVIARRGDHRFDAPRVAVRGIGGGAVERSTPSTAGDRRLDCRLDAGAPPLEEQADGFAGQLPTDRPGRGIEFHSVRQYATGDSARRIDWRHYARRGELATVNYEQPGVATVVFVVDARPESRVVAGPGRPTAVELAAYAGTRALSDLLGAGHEVGVAIVGADGDGPAGLHWLEPGSGADQRTRALEYFRRATAVGGDASSPATDGEPRDRTNGHATARSAPSDSNGAKEASAAGQTDGTQRTGSGPPFEPDGEKRPLKELFEAGQPPTESNGTNGATEHSPASEQSSDDAPDPNADQSASDGSSTAARSEPTTDVDHQVRELLSLTGPGTQFALLSPLLDEGAVAAVETWRAFGRPVIALSPDVVPENTVSGQFEAVRRRTRLADCQATGARTIDWRRGTPLPIALEYAFAADARVGSRSTGSSTGPGSPAGGAGTGGNR